MALTNGVNEDNIYLLDEKEELAKFDDVFALLQEDLAAVWQQHSEVSDAIKWFNTVNSYNVPFGKKNRGMAVVDFYRSFVKSSSEDNIKLARILGWCIEWLQAYFLVSDDIMDHSSTRRGKPCWYKKDEVGLIAINDALYLDNAIYVILKKYFRGLPCYMLLLELFNEVSLQTVFGQNLDLLTSPASGVDFSRFTMKRYKAIVKWKTSFYSFYLPCACAMYLANIYDEQLLATAKNILLKLGEYFQIQDDFLDCFGDPLVTGKIGTDIEDNKCSWLIVQALAKADDVQKQMLVENYARPQAEHVARVKQLYQQLGLEQLYHEYEETSYTELLALIDQSDGDNLPKNVLITFARKFYKRQK